MNTFKEYHFKISIDDFDFTLLSSSPGERGSPAFRGAISKYFQEQLKGFGGKATITVGNEVIEVNWIPSKPTDDPLDMIVEMLEKGDYTQAIIMLKLLLSTRPDDPNILYNLGMALSDMGKLEEAVVYLNKAVNLNAEFENAYVALGVAFLRQGKYIEAADILVGVVERTPSNPYAHRNLGACLLKLGNTQQAIDHLKKSTQLNPVDQRAWFGLAQAFEAIGNTEEADKGYRKVVGIDEYSDIAEMARQARSKIAYSSFKEKTGGIERFDAVMYCLGALQKFEKLPHSEVQKIAFEIAALGMKGLDVNNPEKKYRIKSLEGEFSGLHLVCLEYVAFKAIEPSLDIGFDLSKEYSSAKTMFKTNNLK